MSHTRTLTLLLLAAAALYAAGKDKGKDQNKPEGWLPVAQQDLAIKEAPNQPGEGAIQLYMSYYKDEDAGASGCPHSSSGDIVRVMQRPVGIGSDEIHSDARTFPAFHLAFSAVVRSRGSGAERGMASSLAA